MDREPFEPDWYVKMTADEIITIGLSLLMHQHVPGWPGAEDEQLDAVAKGLIGCLASHGFVLRKVDPAVLAEALQAATKD